MEIKVNVDKKNKQKVLQLISQLVDAEADSGTGIINSKQGIASIREDDSAPSLPLHDEYLEPVTISHLPLGKPKFEKSVAGSWGMFNSFLPGKSALRILARMVKENNGPVSFENI